MILCCVVTHNRLDYTKRTVESLLTTSGKDFHLVVIDNHSSDGTQQYLTGLGDDVTIGLLPDNLFPGAATNIGWHIGLKVCEPDLLMRSDNDVEYLDGWQTEVERAFEAFPELGQIGILNRHEDYDDHQPVTRLERNGTAINVQWPKVGGNCVVPKRLYDEGLRWEPGSWVPNGDFCEDARMSALIKQNGLLVGELISTVANNLSFHAYDVYPDYYDMTATMRGLVPELSV